MIKRGDITVFETLPEIVDPRHSCPVVWDVQNGLVGRIYNNEVAADGGHRIVADAEAIELRMMPVSFRPVAQDLLGQEAFAPQGDEAGPVKVFRMERP